MDNQIERKNIGNRIAIILSTLFIVFGGGYFIYHEVFLMKKSIHLEEIAIWIGMFITFGIAYFLLKKTNSAFITKIILMIILGGIFLILKFLS